MRTGKDVTRWDCDGSGPHAAGETRKYKLGGGANLILCQNCFAHENKFQTEREGSGAYQHWQSAEVYSNG